MNAEYQAPVLFDAPPIGKKFGSVLTDVHTSAPYHAGDIVSAQFVGANPRVSESWFEKILDGGLIMIIVSFSFYIQNNLRLEGTFLTVDQQVSGQWKTVRTDSHPSTVYKWVRTNVVCKKWFAPWLFSPHWRSCKGFGNKPSEYNLVRPSISILEHLYTCDVLGLSRKGHPVGSQFYIVSSRLIEPLQRVRIGWAIMETQSPSWALYPRLVEYLPPSRFRNLWSTLCQSY